MDISVNPGGINYPFLNEYDPLLKNIRDDEQFKKLMIRYGLLIQSPNHTRKMVNQV
ncbi:MAG: hypothetical protein IPN67_03005 [Bacteroidales bacterium]|nr:hypothetical protein [Bacteroidales bacterium]